MEPTIGRRPRVPGSTYRLQFNRDFTFRDALGWVDYWHSLGITDLYAAPFFAARPGSIHGYDVIDHRALNPEIGTQEDLARLHEALEARSMGLLMDVVPNHMCVNTNDNVWWNDVLENGPSSPYAKFFDIDWRPAKAELRDKVLLPVLGDQYGKVLESGALRVAEQGGALHVTYGDRSFPIGPGTYPMVLAGALARLREAGDSDSVGIARLESAMAAARRLPPRSETSPEKLRERQREKETLKTRLDGLLRDHPAVRKALDDELLAMNGEKGVPSSFDKLEALLAQQAYRLSFWRVAAEHINYRRFFEINDLAAVRIEETEVLESVHAKAFELLKLGWVTGLRIDHIDGLREPKKYLETIAERSGGAYVIVEKILAADEPLPDDWATEGTTGYEFLNTLNGLFVAAAGERPLRAFYDGFRTVRGSFADVAYESRRLILRASMSSELSVLARRLDRISEQHRWSRDFTIGTLTEVLTSTIACFPVYRTYIVEEDVAATPRDAARVRAALACAKRRVPSINTSAFDFLGDVLLMNDPEGLPEAARAERREFILRFQELTGPVTAKGIEDTTFFRYFPLLSLNEVGGGPEAFGISIDEFHRRMTERARLRPASLSATSTHDTKRAEDHRARLDVLSEIPGEWIDAVAEWRAVAEPLKTLVNGHPAPDTDDEYYLFQTIVGAWPAVEPDAEGLRALATRLQEAMTKATREAKRNTSWINPDEAYEAATRTFVARLLDPEQPFVATARRFLARVKAAGLMTSLAQLVVKATAPGVPDFYQGTELWDFSMADPDNRRPVDFAARRRHLSEILRRSASGRAALIDELLASPEDGRLKLFLTRELLACRRSVPELFARGAYLPLVVEGSQTDRVIAFARSLGDDVIWTVAARFFAGPGESVPGAAISWNDTTLHVPPTLAGRSLYDVLTGETVRDLGDRVAVAELFKRMPFAVLRGKTSL